MTLFIIMLLLRFSNCAVAQADDFHLFVCVVFLLVQFRDAATVASHFPLLLIALTEMSGSAEVGRAGFVT